VPTQRVEPVGRRPSPRDRDDAGRARSVMRGFRAAPWTAGPWPVSKWWPAPPIRAAPGTL